MPPLKSYKNQTLIATITIYFPYKPVKFIDTCRKSLQMEMQESTAQCFNQQVNTQNSDVEKVKDFNERVYRWMMNEDAMATEKLAEGIRKFAVDQRKLEALITSKL